MRLRVQSYRPSNSAKALAEHLSIQRLSTSGSKFKGKPSDIIVNWGNVSTVHNSIYLNPLQAVKNSANKDITFYLLQQAGVPTPAVFRTKSDLEESTTYFARTDLFGHSGNGIVVGTPSELPSAPLYTQFINKKHEYRAIVVDSQVVDVKKKLKKSNFEGERSPYIWNVANGYVFARNDITFPSTLNQLAIDATNALSLNYGAVDIIEDRSGNLYVLEINTAFGMTGETTSKVGDAIQELIASMSNPSIS